MPVSPRARSQSRTRGGGRFYAPSAGGGGGGGSTPDQLGVMAVPTNVTSGGTGSASTSAWSVNGLFDGAIGDSSGDSWSASAVVPQWVQRQLASPAAVDLYHVIARTSTASAAPSAWTLEGSANGSTGWTVVDTRSGISWTNGQAQAFTVASPASFGYYRMNITAAMGGGGTWPSFTEWRLFAGSVTGSTLVDWYKARAITGISDGASVPAASIVDSGANSHTFTSLVGTSAVRRAGTGYLSRDWVEHTASVYKGSASSPQPSGDVTFFGVIKTSSSSTMGIIGGGSGSSAYLRLNALKLQLVKDDVANVATSTITLSSDTWTPFIVVYTALTGSTKFRVGASTETISGTANVTFSTTATRALAGRDNVGGNEPLTGGWVELGKYAGALNSTDEDALWTYLTT